MAINQVQALAPRQEQRSDPKEPKKDWADRIMEGLQIAGGISGLAVNYQTIQKYRTDRALQQDKIDGRMNAGELTDLQKTHDLSDSPVAGAVRVLKRGEDGKDTPLFASVRQKAEPKDVISITTTGLDGKPVNKLVPKVSGAEYPVYEKPEKGPKDITVQERNTLQSQYDRDPLVKKNRLVFSSFNEAKTYASEKSPASDLSLTIAYFKANDPTSIVKESEAETAAALGGLENRAKAWFSKNAGEGGLTDEQRAGLVRAIELKAQTAAKEQAEINSAFSDLAGRRSVDSKDLRFSLPPEFKTAQGAQGQGAGEAFAAPSDVVPGPALTDIEKELARRAKAGDPALKANAQRGGFGN